MGIFPNYTENQSMGRVLLRSSVSVWLSWLSYDMSGFLLVLLSFKSL